MPVPVHPCPPDSGPPEPGPTDDETIDRVVAWARRHDLEVDPTDVRRVVRARARMAARLPIVANRPDHWTRRQVALLVARGFTESDDDPWGALLAVRALVALLRCADDEGRLHVESDPIAQLIEPITCGWGIGADGRPTVRPGTCRCFWPTSRQVDLGLEQPLDPRPSRFDRFDGPVGVGPTG